MLQLYIISIHAPKRERLPDLSGNRFFDIFQSTLPNGSDDYQRLRIIVSNISIHAPKRERRTGSRIYGKEIFISIHAPKRERRLLLGKEPGYFVFQSTLPNGSDGFSVFLPISFCYISIHAPKRERPAFFRASGRVIRNFNPRSQTGATMSCGAAAPTIRRISIHAPKRERL